MRDTTQTSNLQFITQLIMSHPSYPPGFGKVDPALLKLFNHICALKPMTYLKGFKYFKAGAQKDIRDIYKIDQLINKRQNDPFEIKTRKKTE